MTEGSEEPAARALASVIRIADRRIPFGEAGATDARAHADYLGGLAGFGPTQRVRPVARAWKELADELDKCDAKTVAELDPETVIAYAERIWILPPPTSMLK